MLGELQKNNLGSLIQELNENVKWSEVKERYIYIFQEAIKIWEQENVTPSPNKFGIDCLDYSDVYKLELPIIWIDDWQQDKTIPIYIDRSTRISQCCLLSAGIVGKQKITTMQGDIMHYLKLEFNEFSGIQYGFDGIEEFHFDLNVCKKWHS